MKAFSKSEARIVYSVLLFILVISLLNFRVSLMRSRDHQRKSDMFQVYQALALYHEEFGYYPASNEEGQIVACGTVEEEEKEIFKRVDVEFSDKLLSVYDPCQWGADSIKDLLDPEHKPYLENIPKDPSFKKGFSYRYISTVNNYQILSSLERTDDIEYSEGVFKRNLSCGGEVCNFGRANDRAPVDTDLEEYEQELLENRD